MNEKLRPPKHLSKAARQLWTKLCEEYCLDDAAAGILLESALVAFDECESARRILAREGDFIRDRFGVRKAHPALSVLRDSRATMLACLRALRLDLEPLNSIGRPPSSSRPLAKSEDW